MKIRNGFVSNSSSSSFVCDTKMTLAKVTETLQSILDFYNKLFNTELTFEEVFDPPRYATKEYSKDMQEYWQYKCPVGSLLIESADDNSIPYALFELIEEKFHAYRNHLG